MGGRKGGGRNCGGTILAGSRVECFWVLSRCSFVKVRLLRARRRAAVAAARPRVSKLGRPEKPRQEHIRGGRSRGGSEQFPGGKAPRRSRIAMQNASPGTRRWISQGLFGKNGTGRRQRHRDVKDTRAAAAGHLLRGAKRVDRPGARSVYQREAGGQHRRRLRNCENKKANVREGRPIQSSCCVLSRRDGPCGRRDAVAVRVCSVHRPPFSGGGRLGGGDCRSTAAPDIR